MTFIAHNTIAINPQEQTSSSMDRRSSTVRWKGRTDNIDAIPSLCSGCFRHRFYLTAWIRVAWFSMTSAFHTSISVSSAALFFRKLVCWLAGGHRVLPTIRLGYSGKKTWISCDKPSVGCIKVVDECFVGEATYIAAITGVITIKFVRMLGPYPPLASFPSFASCSLSISAVVRRTEGGNKPISSNITADKYC